MRNHPKTAQKKKTFDSFEEGIDWLLLRKAPLLHKTKTKGESAAGLRPAAGSFSLVKKRSLPRARKEKSERFTEIQKRGSFGLFLLKM